MSDQSRGKENLASELFKRIHRAVSGAFTKIAERHRVLNFPSAQAFGKYEQFFPPEAIAHPAKANSAMIEWIILRYTKPGETIVDPMAGTFSTSVIAAINNRHGIGAELEDKFYKWGLEAKRRIEQIPTLTPKGRMVVLKGDARELSKVLKENADAVVFSPPFASEAFVSKDHDRSEYFKGCNPTQHVRDELYSKNDNVGNLPYGADAVIFSPPFAGTSGGKGEASSTPIDATYPGVFERCIGGNKGAISGDPRNIDNLPYGADAVIFSPPFTNEPFADKKFVIRDRKSSGPSRSADFGPGDIGGLPYITLPDGGGLEVGAVIFSPPFCEANRGGGIAVRGYDKDGKHQDIHLGLDRPLSDAPDNVSNMPYGETLGNLKANTYLGAMLQVYRECFKVLKPGGVMILITKNFIRNKKIVRLDLDTIKLCELGGGCGFKFVERWYRKLEHPSFWRIIYAKKFYYCPQCVKVYRVRKATTDKPMLTKCLKCQAKLKPAMIDVEDILVFRKPAAPMCPACGKHELVPHPSDTLLCPECGYVKTEGEK